MIETGRGYWSAHNRAHILR